MTYFLWGLTAFLTVTVTYHVNVAISIAVTKRLMKKHERKCDVCGVNKPELPHLTCPDGLPKLTWMCRPCAIEAKQFRESDSEKS